MLERADRDYGPIIDAFTAAGKEVGLLVPTPTGLGKSILDATSLAVTPRTEPSTFLFELPPI